ncbi:TetR family transcriptional regulator [Stappia sp. GBMRC 2046]|uniref:TetR family transcriptional regulator n=1 Tax=Stappia sediminis TaxID=2692190 RepID=A0A7X3LTY8_9HYPH|nr:TetR/AcrR family transcriptional regulator [Stappia sediminis]MXN65005.1 TetR family transcriptional regulator [Stappia sediminis]
MGRPRQFEIDAALEMAMRVFWSKGYEATTLPDLLGAMRISRGSFYKAFHDKRAVYLAALERYNRTRVLETVAMLQKAGTDSGRERIEALFKALAERPDRSGCFLCNAAVDRAPHDPEIEERVNAMVQRLEQGFRLALEGDRPNIDPDVLDETAKSLVVNYLGLQVLDATGLNEQMAESCRLQVSRMLEAAVGGGNGLDERAGDNR